MQWNSVQFLPVTATCLLVCVISFCTTARSTVGAVMGALNLLIITTVIVVISVMIRKSRKRKKSLTRSECLLIMYCFLNKGVIALTTPCIYTQ